MKSMYVVSPDFLKAILEESKDFSFSIRGYCSIEEGAKNLKYSNLEDILGFVFVFYELPVELSPLINLINKINLLSDGHPVVLCSMLPGGIDLVKAHVRTNNIKLYIYTDLESMTDIDIKRYIFGSVIQEIYEPYIFEEEGYKKRVFPRKELSYTPPLDKRILTLSEEVIKAPSEEIALKTDEVLLMWKDVFPMLYFLRTQQIVYTYRGSCGNDYTFETLLKDIKNKEDVVLYRIIYDLIKEGSKWLKS